MLLILIMAGLVISFLIVVFISIASVKDDGHGGNSSKTNSRTSDSGMYGTTGDSGSTDSNYSHSSDCGGDSGSCDSGGGDGGGD